MKTKFGMLLGLLAFMIASQFFTVPPAAAQSDREILRLGRITSNLSDWRPDGQLVVLHDQNIVQLYTADYESRAVLPLPDALYGWDTSFYWSPDGTLLAV